MEVKDIVKEAVVISETASFEEAVKKMIDGQTNSLLVVDSEGTLSGEVTVSDLLDAIVPEYLDGDNIAAHFATQAMFEEAVQDARGTSVEFFMNRDIDSVNMQDGLMAVAATAIAHQRARIPVVDENNRPVGVISRRGLKHIIAETLGVPDNE